MVLIEKIRDGSLLEEFLLDRAALGVEARDLAELVSEQLDIPVSAHDVDLFLSEAHDRIDARRAELKQEILESSPSVLRRLEDINLRIFDKLEEADLDQFPKVVNQYHKNLELIARLLGELKESREVSFRASSFLESLEGLLFLESKGLLKLNDREKLELLLREG